MTRATSARRSLVENGPEELTVNWEVARDVSAERPGAAAVEHFVRAGVFPSNAQELAHMPELQADLARITEHYPLTEKQAWETAERVLGRLSFFAIESNPATFDVEKHGFAGRARVLAEIVHAGDPDGNESITIGASVRGVLSGNHAPKITEFELDNLPE